MVGQCPKYKVLGVLSGGGDAVLCGFCVRLITIISRKIKGLTHTSRKAAAAPHATAPPQTRFRKLIFSFFPFFERRGAGKAV